MSLNRFSKNLRHGSALLSALGFLWAVPFLRSDEPSIQKLTELAEQGGREAQWKLGGALEFGRGTEPDLTAASAWYLKAAEQGHGMAMVSIGRLHEKGNGMPMDLRRAGEWYEKALATGQAPFIGYQLVRLSRAGFTEKKYGGIPVEGGFAASVLDTETPLKRLVDGLAYHAKERETGKGYWIGYNELMLSIAARGDAAIPALVRLVESEASEHIRYAGLLTLHLVGIEGKVSGRFEEKFKSRKAREAFWKLIKSGRMADDVIRLLRRDPWPSDVPIIMEALALSPTPSFVALNALARYSVAKSPLDSLEGTDLARIEVTFTLPQKYSAEDFLRLALEGLEKALPGRVEAEANWLDACKSTIRYGNPALREWKGPLSKLLEDMKDLRPVFNFCQDGRPVFFYTEGEGDEAKLHFCGPETARTRLLAWWRKSGREWYCQ